MPTAEQTQTVEFDPETATYDELRARAEQEAQQQTQQTAQDAQQQEVQPRDEQGRFAKTSDKTSEQPVEEVDEVVYRRVIDLGDGSGVQVFEAPSAEELIEKLATAQENATRKIRELSQAKQTPAEQPKERTAEEEWLLSQELLSSPSKTVEKLFEQVVGMPIKTFKTKVERLNAFEQAQAEEQAARDFMAKHPEFHPSPANAKKIEKYVRTYGLDGTKPESIEQAFMDLNESGLLEVKPQEQQQEPEATQTSRIAKSEPPQSQQPVRQTRASSGISARRNMAQRSAPEPTEDDLYSMPLDKLRALALSSESQ